jgi:hypothetical protein
MLSVIWFYITSPDLLIIFFYSIMNPHRTCQRWNLLATPLMRMGNGLVRHGHDAGRFCSHFRSRFRRGTGLVQRWGDLPYGTVAIVPPIHPPLDDDDAPPAIIVVVPPLSSLPPRVFGWLLRLFIDWGPPKTTTKFDFLIFCPLFWWPKRCTSVLPHRQDWADSQLVVASPHPLEAIENQGPVALVSVFIFHCSLFDPPKWQANVLSHTFRPVASPLQCPTLRRHHRSVGCSVPSSNGSHPWPMLRPYLNFSLGAIGAPQSRDPTAASPSPCARCLQ